MLTAKEIADRHTRVTRDLYEIGGTYLERRKQVHRRLVEDIEALIRGTEARIHVEVLCMLTTCVLELPVDRMCAKDVEVNLRRAFNKYFNDDGTPKDGTRCQQERS